MDDYDFNPSNLKPKPSKGRRAKKEAAVEKKISELSLDDDIEKPQKAPRVRKSERQTGWGSNTNAQDKVIVDSRLIQRDDEDETELEFIPDLDDIQDEDMAQEIAAPPQLLNKDIATYRELDADLMNSASFRMLDESIDLKMLVRNLSSQDQIREEEDMVWSWDKLFTDVSSNLKSKKTNSAKMLENEND